MKRHPKPQPESPKPFVWPRADPVALAAFDPETKECSMNCGQSTHDPRSWKECKFMCDECYTKQPMSKPIHEQIVAKIPLYETLSFAESGAVAVIVSNADEFGYGNLMAWLATMWNVRLMEKMPHLKEGELPMPTVTTTPYPIKP
jgi:hypothetical protein